MKVNFISVPFTADGNQGFSESTGIAKFSSAGIIFEFDSKIFGFVGGDIKEVRVSMNEILDVKLRRGISKFFASIHLRLKSFVKLAELPHENGKVKLKIKREDFERAAEAVELILQFIINERPEILPENNSNSQLPAQISVNDLIDTEELTPEHLQKIKSDAERGPGSQK